MKSVVWKPQKHIKSGFWFLCIKWCRSKKTGFLGNLFQLNFDWVKSRFQKNKNQNLIQNQQTINLSIIRLSQTNMNLGFCLKVMLLLQWKTMTRTAAKGRNRQVLRDIGNVVRRNHPKNIDPAKINHPRTRSQHAPLVEVTHLKVCSFLCRSDNNCSC